VDGFGSVLVKGSLIGNATNPAIISARGQAVPTPTADVAIGRLEVRGRAEFAQVLAGYDGSGNSVNADAQVGAVTVGGDWVASSLAAGATPGPNGFFGDGDDAKIAGAGVKDDPGLFSRIASVTIGGQIVGTVGGAGHYGIVAENIGAVSVGGTVLPLSPGPHNDNLPVGITDDFDAHEV